MKICKKNTKNHTI